MLNGTTEANRWATYFHPTSYGRAQSVVGYALVSHLVLEWGIYLVVEDPLLDLLDHGILQVYLLPPASPPL